MTTSKTVHGDRKTRWTGYADTLGMAYILVTETPLAFYSVSEKTSSNYLKIKVLIFFYSFLKTRKQKTHKKKEKDKPHFLMLSMNVGVGNIQF